MPQASLPKKGAAVPAALCVLFLTVSCYLLSFSGVPTSDDEELYASAARNLAVKGTLSAEQLSGNLRLLGRYHGVEPLFPALASLWYRLFWHTGIGNLQSLYLLPILYSALSAALIVVIACQLGYDAKIGAAAGLLYGLSSMAWPYAKTFLREPLIGLLLLGSLSIFLWLARGRRPAWGSALISIVLIFLLIGLVLTRVVMAVAAVVLILALVSRAAANGSKNRVILITLGSLGLSLVVAACLASIRATDADVFYRFTGSFIQDALTRLTTISHAHLVEALLAPIFSPWKGLLFYAPICLLGLVGAVLFLRQHPEISALSLMTLCTLLLTQALAYDDQWWTPTWGSRFLLPVVPLLVVSSLPVMEWLAGLGSGGWTSICAVFAAGLLIQFPAVLFNSSTFTALDAQRAWAAFPEALIWNIGRAPLIAQWTLASVQAPDLLLWRTASVEPAAVLLVCVSAAALGVLAALLMRRTVLEDAGDHRNPAMLTMLAIAALLVALPALLKTAGSDPAYEKGKFEPVCAFIKANIQPSEVLIVQPYPGPVWDYLMDGECGQKTWYSLPYHGVQASGAQLRERANDLIVQAVPPGARYWMLQQFWSATLEPGAESLAVPGDQQLSEQTFLSPVQMVIASYRRAPQP